MDAWFITITAFLEFFVAPVAIVKVIQTFIMKKKGLFKEIWLPFIIAVGIVIGFLGIVSITLMIIYKNVASLEFLRLCLIISGIGFVLVSFRANYWAAFYLVFAFLGILFFNLMNLQIDKGLQYFMGIYLSGPKEGNDGALVLYGVLLAPIVVGFLMGIVLEVIMRIMKNKNHIARVFSEPNQ